MNSWKVIQQDGVSNSVSEKQLVERCVWGNETKT